LQVHDFGEFCNFSEFCYRELSARPGPEKSAYDWGTFAAVQQSHLQSKYKTNAFDN
jgi:hypothetical protein